MLNVQNLTKTFSDTTVVNAIDFTVGEKEIFALLGPSGCGKTTTLRLIAGFEKADHGKIELLGQPIGGKGTHVPPEKRGVGFVFQNYALFPHLSVIQNVAFGLKDLPKAKRMKRAEELLEMVRLQDLQHRSPQAMSGGEQQRVALARSMGPNPKLILLDEPFSSLDPELRESTRLEVHKLLKSVKMSAILVTHDTEEALSFADRIAVMRQGQIEQVGTPEEIYHKPETAFVANFLGQSNIIQGIADGRRVQTQLGQLQIESPAFGQVSVSIRPEHLVMETPNGGCVGTVCKRDFKGSDLTYEIDFNDHRCLVQTNYDCPVQVGQSVEVKAVESAVVVQEQT
ncbi:iron ABC transporter ATP-binding protein [Candidatus Poribacteria bacterium]|nr:iron ABC transporter ATP-binding protein [Candidatus Poribacteria bacterium]